MSRARAVIGRLQSLRELLLNPIDFYEGHLGEYRELGSTVAFQTLINLRPEDADPVIWEAQAVEIAALVRSEITVSIVGMVISLIEPKVASASTIYQLNGLSIGEVERFVAAGRDKEDTEAPGKNFKAMDDGKSDLQIAWRILYALRLHKPGAPGLEAAIMRFLASEQRGEAERLLPEVLKAWVDVFTVKAGGDWRRWVHEAVTSLT